MTIETILSIIALFLIYATGLIGVYVNLQVKLKEFEIKLLTLKDELNQHKLITGINLLKLEERNTLEHDNIKVKIDLLLEKVTEIRVEQASVGVCLAKTKQNHE